MSAPILDRLAARIAAEPNLTDFDTLFVDLQDARSAIMAGDAALGAATAIKQAPQSTTATSSVTEVYALMVDAKERLSVHALSTVADYIDRAIKLLEPTPKETT